LKNQDLSARDLTEINGLVAVHLSGTNLTGAKLPANVTFTESLANIAELCKNTGKLFGVLIAALAFAVIMAFKIKDPQLLTDTGVAVLPVVAIELPARLFFGVIPIVVLVLYFLVHFYLRRLCVLLAHLPAIFPDGMPVDQKVYPWLMNDIVRRGMPLLKTHDTALATLQGWLFHFLAFTWPYLMMIVVWLRCLVRHDWVLTGWQILSLVGLIVGSFYFGYGADRALGADRKFLWWTYDRGDTSYKPARQFALRSAQLLVCSLGLIGFSYASIRGTPEHRVPQLLASVGLSSFANLEAADITTPPEKWTDPGKPVPVPTPFPLPTNRKPTPQEQANQKRIQSEIATSQKTNAEIQAKYDSIRRGAQLQKARLEFAEASSAFLPKADLIQANLSGANLSEANLREAKFWKDSWNWAEEEEFDSRRANLTGADLTAAYLTRADLTGVIISLTDITWPDGTHTPPKYCEDAVSGKRISLKLERVPEGDDNLIGDPNVYRLVRTAK
jgi:uncharacterized protein YjbI with pentapeptide repeats